MATSLCTQLISNFKGDALDTVASVIGETPARTENALDGVLPALFSGLASKASTSGQATDLLDIIRIGRTVGIFAVGPAVFVEAPQDIGA